MIAEKNPGLIPTLAAALKDKEENVSSIASRALGALGPDAVPTLLEVLKAKKSASSLIGASNALKIIGPKAKAAVPLLTQVLKIDDWVVRRSSIEALGRIGPEAKSAIPAMIEALGDFPKSEEFLRGIGYAPTVDGRGNEVGHNAFFLMDSLPYILEEMLIQINPEIRNIFSVKRPKEIYQSQKEAEKALLTGWQQTYEALKKKYPMQAPAVPSNGKHKEGAEGDSAPKIEIGKKDQGPLFAGQPTSYWLDQFNDADPKFRAKALVALGNIAQKNKNLIPVLVDSLKDKDYKVGIVALKALGSLGPDAKPAIPAMVDALGEYLKSEDIGIGYAKFSSDSGYTATAEFMEQDFPHVLAWALKRIDPEIKQIQNFPPQSGKGKDLNEAKQALLSQWQKAYDELKKNYPTQRPPLPSNQQSKEGAEGNTVLKTEIGKKDDEPSYEGKSASFWLDQLQDAKPHFRYEAVKAIGSIAQKKKELIPALQVALNDNDYKVGTAAAKALGDLGPEAVPAILEVLKEKISIDTFERAAFAAGIMGPQAKATVPLLSQGLKLHGGQLRISTVNALGQIGPEAKPAIPAMIEALGDFLKSKIPPTAIKILAQNGDAHTVNFAKNTFPMRLVTALKKIDPEIENLPSTLGGWSGRNREEAESAMLSRWNQAYDQLRKKYSMQNQKTP